MNVWVLIYRFAWTMLGILGLVALFYFFYPPVRRMHELQNQQAKLEEQNRFDEELLRHLKTKEEKLMKDPRFVEKIARDELGYAKPGETVFKFVDDELTNTLTAH
jgi:cell division protein FtsB